MLQQNNLHESVTCALIALGANKPSPAGGPAQTLAAALARLPRAGLAVARVSRFFATPAFPAGSGPDFVNAAAALETTLAPGALLEVLHGVEAGMGRERRARWAPRAIDLDLVAMDDAVLPDASTFRAWTALSLDEQMRRAPDRLILPHPRLHERGFVLAPLADVAPGWRHPVFGLTVAEMLAALPPAARAEIRPLPAPAADPPLYSGPKRNR